MLDHMYRRLYGERTFAQAIRKVLDDARALNGAEFGTLQLCLNNCLVIVHHHGFRPLFLKTFRNVEKDEGSSCGRALRSGKTVLIEDVDLDEEFAAYRDVARAAGFRSVATTPLVTSNRQTMGVVSTHFARVHMPTPLEIDAFEQYCVGASDYLWELRGEETVADIALAMSTQLYDEAETALAGEDCAEPRAIIFETPAPRSGRQRQMN